MTIPPEDGAAPTPGLSPQPELLDGFAPEEFRVRRATLRAACTDGIVLVRGATEAEAVDPGVYRQNSHFFYLTGVDAPGAYLVLLPESIPASAGLRDASATLREILFLPARNPRTETYNGPSPGPGEETERATGFEKVADSGALWNALSGWLRRCATLYLVAPYGEQAKSTPDFALMTRIGNFAPITQFRDATFPIAKMRVIKSSAEIERMTQAIAITVEGHKTAHNLIVRQAASREYEVEAAIFSAFRRQGAGLAFATIVGSGLNATVLHHTHNRGELKEGDAVVVDIGARVSRYCGDLTRTYPVGGRFSERQREVYELVLAAHRHVVESFRPGEDTLKDQTDRCRAFFKESPLRSHDSAGVEQTMDAFLPHGISHHLGLDVHDLLAYDLIPAPGSVITIEPGIYLPSEGIGVRLEDDYLVTQTGLQRLGPELPMDLSYVESEAH